MPKAKQCSKNNLNVSENNFIILFLPDSNNSTASSLSTGRWLDIKNLLLLLSKYSVFTSTTYLKYPFLRQLFFKSFVLVKLHKCSFTRLRFLMCCKKIWIVIAWRSLDIEESLVCQITSPFNNKLGCFLIKI